MPSATLYLPIFTWIQARGVLFKFAVNLDGIDGNTAIWINPINSFKKKKKGKYHTNGIKVSFLTELMSEARYF